MSEDKKLFDMQDANPDPINGQPGAHPIGTGVGAASAGTIGAAFGGAVGGPVGAVVGAAVGAVAGGLFGKNAAEVLNPTVEDDYWRTHYSTRPYVESHRRYEDYRPAYRTGYEGYQRYSGTGKRYDEVEPELRRDYEQHHGQAGLAWEHAKHATRDAWHRVETARPAQHHGQGSNLDQYPAVHEKVHVHKQVEGDRSLSEPHLPQRSADRRRDGQPIVEVVDRRLDEPRNSL